MEIIKLKGHVLNLYDSIKELPISRSMEFKKYFLQDIGIGTEIKDIDDHLEKIFIFAQRNQLDDIVNEAKNLRFNFFNLISGVDLKSMCVACLLHSIDNKVFKSPDEAHQALLELDPTDYELEHWLVKIKKKLDTERRLLLPQFFADSGEHLERVKELLLFKVRLALEEVHETDPQFKEMFDYFINLKKPFVFDPYDEANIIKQLDAQFEETVFILEDNGQTGIKLLDEYSYFYKILLMQKKHRPHASQQDQFS